MLQPKIQITPGVAPGDETPSEVDDCEFKEYKPETAREEEPRDLLH